MKKIAELLQDKAKDFGLTAQAIETIATAISEGLNDKSTEEEIAKAIERGIQIAKITQGEITRKSQSSNEKHESEKSALLKQIEELKAKVDPNKEDKGKDEPEWFKSYREQQEQAIKQLKEENENFKLEQAKKQRAEQISEKAKELGIPPFMMKHFSIADDADYEKILTDMKQELVANSLDGQFGDHRSSDTVDKAAAIDYVNSL